MLSHVQMVMVFALYGGQSPDLRAAVSLVARRLVPAASGWVLLYPGTWFGSYLELASGRRSLA